MPSTSPPIKLPTPTEIRTRLRHIGYNNSPIPADELESVWRKACAELYYPDLIAVRRGLLKQWDDLPDDRLRRSGNGRLLQALLDATGRFAWPKYRLLPADAATYATMAFPARRGLSSNNRANEADDD